MENIVYTRDFPCWLQLKCNISNLTHNRKWSNKMLLQVGKAKESQIFVGQYNFIPNLEVYNPMLLIKVSLMSLLCILHSSLGSTN